MDHLIKLPKKQTYIILCVLGVIILSFSLETMMRVKDMALYEIWYNEMGKGSSLSYDDAFSVYVTGNLAVYFFKVIVPMAFGVHTYFAYTKIRINKLFIFIWSVLLIGSAGYIFIEKQWDSIFYYTNLLGYVVLIMTLLYLNGVIDNQENL